MTGISVLEGWLQQATRHLSKDSAARVRSEIQDHFVSAREAAISRGAAAEDAGRFAFAALGDPRTANRQYRSVLLTSAEARMLREGNCEARAVCARPWLKGLMLTLPLVVLLASAVSLLTGATALAQILLIAGIAIGILFIGPFLPVYTPARARAYRAVKWVVVTAALVLAFGPNPLRWFWLLMSCLWPMAWIEWTRISIRRKLPVAQWPKQLYL